MNAAAFAQVTVENNAQQNEASLTLFYGILNTDVDKVKTVLAKNPGGITLSWYKAEEALLRVATTWCNDPKADEPIVKQLTAMLSQRVKESDKVDIINRVFRDYKVIADDPEAVSDNQQKLYKRFEVVDTLIPQVSIASFLLDMKEMESCGLVTQAELITGINSLIDKAKNEENRAIAVNYLTQATALKGFVLTADKSKIGSDIAKVEKSLDAKDKELLTKRIITYFKYFNVEIKETAPYYTILGKMVQEIFAMKGDIQGAKDEPLLCEIMLGTSKRDFRDSLLFRINDIASMPDNIRALLGLLFIGANNTFEYEGEEYTPTTLLETLISYQSFYGPDFVTELADRKNYNMSSYIRVFGQSYMLKDIWPEGRYVFPIMDALKVKFVVK